jgi:hypothetical protein
MKPPIMVLVSKTTMFVVWVMLMAILMAYITFDTKKGGGAMIEKILNKLLSGRYFATVSVIGTYCIVLLATLYLVMKESLSVEAFLGLFAAFAVLAKEIVQSYFNRTDRKEEEK